MSSAEDLKQLLRPLGVYRLENSFFGAELDSVGSALDALEQTIEDIQQEMLPDTARGEGLERLAALFRRRPAAEQPEQMAAALAALLRIADDSFTLRAINDTVSGCGVNAVVEETGINRVSVWFPSVRGIPAAFDRIQEIVEDVLPAHVGVEYQFWYQTWGELNRYALTWRTVEQQAMTWRQLEILEQ